MTAVVAAPVRAYILVAVLLLGVALGGTSAWWVQTWRLGAKVAKVESRESQGKAGRAEAALKNETATATLESKHAKDTIYNSDKLAGIQTGIAVDLRAELARAHSLQLGAESRAATYRAQAQADATARRDLADKAAALDASLAGGRVVAAKLRGSLKQRDAEVATLCEQVNIERALNDAGAPEACSQ